MQVDPNEFRQLVSYLLQSFRQMEKELLAHQIVMLGIRQSAILGDELDVLLKTARDCPELQEHLREKYDIPMQKITEALEAEVASAEALALLRICKPPTGPTQ